MLRMEKEGDYLLAGWGRVSVRFPPHEWNEGWFMQPWEVMQGNDGEPGALSP